MADRNERYPDNAPGVFYVDRGCINCSLCAEVAPDNFRHGDGLDHDVCFKQPVSPAESELCIEAMESCPVEAIGNDGNL